jgi:hypothetical protein
MVGVGWRPRTAEGALGAPGSPSSGGCMHPFLHCIFPTCQVFYLLLLPVQLAP